jgi:hypothetical protein
MEKLIGTAHSKKEQHLDEKIDSFIEHNLMPFHTLLSKHNMDLKSDQLDLAIEKIASAMTALSARTKQLRKEGKYAK